MNLVESLIFVHFSYDKRLQKKDLLQVKHDATEITRTQDPPGISSRPGLVVGHPLSLRGGLGRRDGPLLRPQ